MCMAACVPDYVRIADHASTISYQKGTGTATSFTPGHAAAQFVEKVWNKY